MFQRKLGTYAEHAAGLRQRGIRYLPLVYSCYGRAHPEASAALEAIARRACRRHGLPGHHLLLRRANCNIAVQLWRRSAAMVRACLPSSTRDDVQRLLGDAFDVG